MNGAPGPQKESSVFSPNTPEACSWLVNVARMISSRLLFRYPYCTFSFWKSFSKGLATEMRPAVHLGLHPESRKSEPALSIRKILGG